MEIFNQIKPLQTHLNQLGNNQKNIGLVPTMGALHAGHISLVKKALQENDYVVISIFVNPTQFNNANDLEKYPRTLDADVEKLKDISNDLVIFSPTVEEIYHQNVNAQHFDFDGLEFQMEGKFRTGHFDGVGTIVKRLFEIVQPAHAYFGEKDFQQLQIIKKMVAKENLPVQVIGCPILREENGLAMSSRNERLSTEVRTKAAFIFKTLKEAQVKFDTKSATQVKEWVSNQFKKNKDFVLEYIEIADESTLKTITKKSNNKKYRAFIAVYADDVRLIDNIALN
ncbi:pantoate--beta-alanine ligase [Zhouia sp. PK063]|uniref:pantoate--beta-alanine ligase n=1 Tax=Zhouia sp. PK063 TaxID=3373602 RepID=UPI0037883EE0